MMSMEQELAGECFEVECPFCDGEGETNRDLRFIEDPTVVSPSEKTKEKIEKDGGIWIHTQLKDPKECPFCGGSGTLEDVPVYGTISIPAPPGNEGYL